MKKLLLFLSLITINVIVTPLSLLTGAGAKPGIKGVIFDVNGVLVHRSGPQKDYVIDKAMIRLVDSLRSKGIKTYILSNMSNRTYDALSKANQLFNHFDGVICSVNVGVAKPEKESFLKVCELYNLDPATCIFIDDTPGHVAAAKNLGMHGIEFTSASDCVKQLQMLIPNLQLS